MTRHERVAAALVGRAIVAVELRPFSNGRGTRGMTTDPVLVLDDGSRVSFVVAETDHGGEYGVELFRSRRSRR